MATPQLARILADLDAIPDVFRLDEGKLGERLIGAAVDGVKATIAAGEAPDGTPWADLSAAYEAWKSRNYPGQPIGRLEDLMADDAQVEGDHRVGPEEAEVTYGISEEARQEAEWFQEGSDDRTRPPRDFYDFTPESLDAIAAILDERFDSILK